VQDVPQCIDPEVCGAASSEGGRVMAKAKGDPIGTRAWRKLRDQVVAEEPECTLRLDEGCTLWSQTADHIINRSDRPDLAMDRTNLRGACFHCNSVRGGRDRHARTKRWLVV
jgi:5-methylcytosine-specific restriction endonuclease McrA